MVEDEQAKAREAIWFQTGTPCPEEGAGRLRAILRTKNGKRRRTGYQEPIIYWSSFTWGLAPADDRE